MKRKEIAMMAFSSLIVMLFIAATLNAYPSHRCTWELWSCWPIVCCSYDEPCGGGTDPNCTAGNCGYCLGWYTGECNWCGCKWGISCD